MLVAGTQDVRRRLRCKGQQIDGNRAGQEPSFDNFGTSVASTVNGDKDHYFEDANGYA